MRTHTSWWSATVPALVVGVLLSAANLPRYRHLAREGVRVDGVVTTTCERMAGEVFSALLEQP